MSLRHFAQLFHPRSIAIIGASERPQAVGAIVMRNLLQAGFPGRLMPVNRHYQTVFDQPAFPDVDSLPQTPDLAILCIPADRAIRETRRLAARGCGAAVVFSADPPPMPDDVAPPGGALRSTLAAIAAQSGLRVLGPFSLGLIVPGSALNASALHVPALPGRVAFVSQSTSIASAVLDWARPKGIGFSHFISLGESADIDLGDLLDYLASDASTRAILLYLETIHERRNFMSAARAAARNKPVLAIKAGRGSEAARAATTHTGAIAGSDAVFDAAFRRAGMLRVYDLDEMFSAVETLARVKPPRGPALAILSNGGGVAIMAVDELSTHQGNLAEFTADTIARLHAQLRKRWSGSNPVDIRWDAAADDYRHALEILLDAAEIDAVLVLYAPTATHDPADVAAAIVDTARHHRQKNVMTCWLGNERVESARHLLREAGLPTYETPPGAIRAFQHLLQYRRNQDMLMETPEEAPTPPQSAVKARTMVARALAEGQSILPETDARALLEAYGIPFVESRTAGNPAEAGRIAAQFGGPVAVKILSTEIDHKSDVGGVLLNLQGAFDVEKACNRLLDSLATIVPDAIIDGFTVQKMAHRPFAQEIIIGVTTDPIFGPAIMFGQGGTAVDVVGDFAIGLPPLNSNLARGLIQRTRVARLLSGYRDHPAANLDAICTALMMVSQLIIDIPEIIELDINPLFADATGVLAVDCRVRIGPTPQGKRLAIRPYPKDLEETVTLRGGRVVLLRPIRPEDEPNHHRFVANLTAEDLRFRFFGTVHSLPHSEMARLTQIDYDREMAFIAVDSDGQTLGVVRAVCDPDNETAEFAVVTRSDLQGSGLGRRLMKKLIDYCRSRGTGTLVGQILTDNRRMLSFVASLGFKRTRLIENDIAEVRLDLRTLSATDP